MYFNELLLINILFILTFTIILNISLTKILRQINHINK